MDRKKFLLQWEKSRQKGKIKYVLITSITAGLACLIGGIAGKTFAGNFFNKFLEYNIYIFLSIFLGGFLGGMLASIATWESNEEKYNKLLNKK